LLGLVLVSIPQSIGIFFVSTHTGFGKVVLTTKLVGFIYLFCL